MSETGLEEKVENMNVEEKEPKAGAKGGGKAKGEKKKKEDPSAFPLELKPAPDFIDERIPLFDRLKAEYDAQMEAKEKTPIKVTLRDGKVVDGLAWKTTPYEIASSISQGLADNTVVCKVNGEVFDLDRVLEGDCSLEFLKFEDDDARAVFWHSSAHIMGEAMERHYGGHLCYGPPIEEGYYYDMFLDGRQVSSNDYSSLDTLTKSIVKEKQPFVRLEMSKEDLLEMFKYNEFKCRIIREKVKTPTTTVYRCGPLIDLCRGPHVRHTGKIKAMQVTKNSATYWEGNCEAESLQRLYGISFPNDKQMKEWKKFQEEAAKRDHRKLGRDHELFFFHELSPGSCFFLPKGAHVYNKLIDFLKEEYKKRGFQEVISPNIYSTKLWETSGHWQHYSENMFSFEVEKERYALKPMNCPGHCVIRFQQDDAHIFCRPDQIGDEIKGCLDFLRFVYNKFGFSFKLYLSTRPDKYMGKRELWDSAEKELENSLNEFGMDWRLNPGDGAFYGPKIDIQIQDALRRYHQCATIQLDFQLPERFNLTYVSGEGDDKKRPVIIHRAILGSVERMIAVLTENFGGKWPFWLSPTQAIVIPVSPKYEEYANKVKQTVFSAGYLTDVDLDHGTTLNKKIRNAQLAQYNFIFVVGEKEENSNTVNVRTRDNKVQGEKTIDQVLEKFAYLANERIKDSEDEF
ncbi:Threonine--tRNA ligase 1, cytoplasmic [Desmophyllum pertusum]|uniref:threonine--tRNA ligase n=1 Tax=Desmophyllum pertusum TaxID=174260 RepID=A0A9W9YUP9_9CNID|nr:Threonine--tRNA ligase 1, cytoplasmic [Desmophyllum pertusum]